MTKTYNKQIFKTKKQQNTYDMKHMNSHIQQDIAAMLAAVVLELLQPD